MSTPAAHRPPTSPAPTAPQPSPAPSTSRPLAAGSVAVVLGTRPEIIKLAGIVAGLGPAARVVHTGQHYDPELSAALLRELGLPTPAVQLAVGGQSRGVQIGRGLVELDDHLRAVPTAAVVVQGDTNATLSGALAANAAGIPLVHVEAGLRSRDRAMPEEHNRVVVDHLSDLCCAPTADNVRNLAAEGIVQGVVETGSTVVEATLQALPGPAERAGVLAEFGLRDGAYVLATIHRPENTDDGRALKAILRALRECGLPVVLALHPRTRAAAERHGLTTLLDGLQVVGPLGSSTFLALARHAALIVSDSGGIQEECTVLKRPLVVVRRSTERPESLRDFARLVLPDQAADAIDAVRSDVDVLDRLAALPSPYGSGDASQRIVDELLRLVGSSERAAAAGGTLGA